MSELFDELARALTRPMPRRRALRVLGGALVAVAVPGTGALRSAQAIAGVRQSSVLSSVCEKTCSGTFPVPCLCKGPTHGCFEECGMAGSTCCCYKGADGKNAGVAACPPGTRCGDPRRGESNCMCIKTCGSPFACCREDQFCANPTVRLCCKHGERGCGRMCCKPNEECRRIQIGTGSQTVCEQKCPPNRAWCGRNTCCPPRWYCINERTGLCKRCRRDQEECGTKCCDKATSRCCRSSSHAYCCRNGRDCCEGVCCPPRTKCARQILPGQGGLTAGSPRVCCPPDRQVPGDTMVCCPPGQVSLGGKVVVGPGIQGLCCNRSQVCGSGATITCCASGSTGTQTCCGGKCVDLQFDAQNCGRCGNVCPSGVCRQGVCASA